MTTQRATIPFIVATITGMALWFAASVLTGRREPWDAGVYWAVAYPIAIALSGLLGFLFPQRPWRWALVLFLSQFVAMCIRNGELGNLWPLGMALFAVLSVPGILAAHLASGRKARFNGGA